eukprot:GHVU01069478.1.p1 GENE.GHVU01069478.1~~GHVU01069478.1.p1  ORF type:complete len:265 (+),score=32.46 GHVU01069478.1:3818-4612(+)
MKTANGATWPPRRSFGVGEARQQRNPLRNKPPRFRKQVRQIGWRLMTAAVLLPLAHPGNTSVSASVRGILRASVATSKAIKENPKAVAVCQSQGEEEIDDASKPRRVSFASSRAVMAFRGVEPTTCVSQSQEVCLPVAVPSGESSRKASSATSSLPSAFGGDAMMQETQQDEVLREGRGGKRMRSSIPAIRKPSSSAKSVPKVTRRNSKLAPVGDTKEGAQKKVGLREAGGDINEDEQESAKAPKEVEVRLIGNRVSSRQQISY